MVLVPGVHRQCRANKKELTVIDTQLLQTGRFRVAMHTGCVEYGNSHKMACFNSTQVPPSNLLRPTRVLQRPRCRASRCKKAFRVENR